MPGFLRSEAMLDHFGVTEENWRDAIAKDQYFAGSETPLYLGRAVAAIAADKARIRWSGEAVSSGEVAKYYGVTDYEGRQPDIMAFFAENLPANFFGEGELERGIGWLERVMERAKAWLPRQGARPSSTPRPTSRRRRRGKAGVGS
jgi:hypothetical protein